MEMLLETLIGPQNIDLLKISSNLFQSKCLLFPSAGPLLGIHGVPRGGEP